MIYLLLILFIQTTTFGQTSEHMISVFVENLNEHEYDYEEDEEVVEEAPEKTVEEVVAVEEVVEEDIEEIIVFVLPPISHEKFPDVEDFFVAIKSGDTHGVVKGLSKDIHPDTRALHDMFHGSTALMEATSHRRFLIVRMLLRSGADPNLSTYSLGVSNITPLMVASQQGPLEIVQELVHSGADVNIHTTGRITGSTALMAAVRSQKEDIVNFLLERGADVNASTTSGEVTGVTPLMIAAQTGNIDIVKALLQTKKADIVLTDSIGRNVLVYAYMSGSIALVKYLSELGITTDFPPARLREFMRGSL